MEKSRRQRIGDMCHDLMACFLYYDRKEDERAPVGYINEALREGEITVDEMVTIFREHLERATKKV